MYTYLIIIIALFTGCASKEKNLLAWETWKGLPVSEIDKHPYFKNLKRKTIKNPTGPQTWLYKDQTPFQTSAYCSSLGGCMGMPIYNCENVFSVENGKILAFQQNGTCPGARTVEAGSDR